MARRPLKTFFYKQAEFLSGPEFNVNADVHGFSVRYNQPFYERDLFKFHFRSDFLYCSPCRKGWAYFLAKPEGIYRKTKQPRYCRPHAIKKVAAVSKDSIVSGVNFTIEFLAAIGMPKNAVELLDYFSSQFSPHWNLDEKDASSLQLLIKQLNNRVTSLNEHVYGKNSCIILFIFFYTKCTA
jgi:hypothetical protein